MAFLPENYTLDLMLMPDDTYYLKLIELAKQNPRIRFLPVVPTTEIIPFLNSYDIGLFLLPPTNFNYLNALPNKLFEFIQARLAIVVSPNPEMKQLVKTYTIGEVSEDYTPQAFAKAIQLITPEKLIYYKENTIGITLDETTSQAVKDVLIKMLNQINKN